MATRTSPLEELTHRQREVLELVACGMTNGEIATHLGISLDGAKWHVSEIISRLSVDSLPAFFTEDGLLGLSSSTWGADRLLDLETFEFASAPLPGIYNRWGEDTRVAVGGGYAGGHGGICV